ncbi:sorbitol dehydrogenase-like isoform X2 [Acanthaster planci]|uniref:Sorbitol dehydrogenase n=1 Tax=Acanthaster planci TaxID=133434 RepID=A0A8B7ZMS8_ACAPL|nr:sorbitol dehydrogenase-like isoform X2 [Acanthaster planci]
MSVTERNLTAVLKKKGKLVLEDTPVPQPGPDEVQIRVHSVGICGSDVHYLVDGKIGRFVVNSPMILGHESSGIVSALGEGVTNLKVGDRVAIEPGVPCRMCSYCKEGRYNLCPDIVFCATPPVDGSLRRFYCHAADFCYRLPDHVTLDEGALLEPLAVGVYSCQRGGVKLGSNVLVLGSGPIGLMCLLSAKAMGAAQIIVTDLDQGRLDMAVMLGAHHALRVDTRDGEKMAHRVEEALGRKPDISIECSGAEPSVQTGIYATKSGGVVVLVGRGRYSLDLPLVNAAVREVDIKGVFRYVNCYPLALEMIASGKVDAKPLITHHFPLEKTLEAFETSRTGAGGAIKVMIHCDQ